MKILMITPDLDSGGAQLAMTRLAAGLAGSHEVTVYSMTRPSRDNLLRKELRRAGAGVFSGPFRGLVGRVARRLSLLDGIHRRRLQGLRRKRGIQVVNSHQAEAERLACEAFATTDIPLIGTDHGCYRALLKPVSGLGKKEDYVEVFRRSDGLVCLSQSNLEVAARHSWKPGFRTWKIYNGYPLPSAASIARQESNRDPFVFGMIARGIPEKGWAEAVAAFQRVRANVSREVILRLAGTGPGLDKVLREFTFEQLKGVEFLGHVDDVPSLLRGLDAGLLPTWFELESLPNTIVEYLAHGIPVVTSPAGGIPEMLETSSGLAGLLVPMDASTGRVDVNLLAAAMERLATDEDFRRSLAQKGLEAARKFDLARAVSEYAKVFHEVTTRKKAEIGK